MDMENLIKTLEKIRDNYTDNYALTEYGFKNGINEAIKQIKDISPPETKQSCDICKHLSVCSRWVRNKNKNNGATCEYYLKH